LELAVDGAMKIIYHHDADCWWAESPDVGGWSTAGASFLEVKRLAEESIEFAVGRSVLAEHVLDSAVADENGNLSLQEAADCLGFSRQHVHRLTEAGELEGVELRPNCWRVPIRSVLDFERRRSQAEERAEVFSRFLDDIGGPAE
jgi:predicted RNase H-like HicB family nuclease